MERTDPRLDAGRGRHAHPERDTIVRVALSPHSFPVRLARLLSRSLIADDLARPFLLINVSLFGLERRFFVTGTAAPLMPSIDAATWRWGKMSQLGRVGSILGAAADAGFRRNGVGH